MAREYRGEAGELGGLIAPKLTLAHAPERLESVTAIDSRDVEPLIEALREIADAPDPYGKAALRFQAAARHALQPFTGPNSDPKGET